MKTISKLLTLSLAIWLSACSWLPDQIDETKGWSANRLYVTAKKALVEEEYESAIKYYELLISRYPYGRYAQQAQLEIAYAYYKFEEPASALAAANRFIKLHPSHPHVDYAYYLKGLINFNRSSHFLERIFPQDPSTRDPGTARKAFFDFRRLVKKFPQSRYAEDARLRMLYLRNNLARHEIHVARFYMQRQAFVAAVNRCKYVMIHYDRAPAVPFALDIMAQAYTRLGLHKLAADSRRVLKKNFPKYNPLAQLGRQRSWWQIF
jgi:outer membrane protein assembly factor BamD